MRAGPGGWAEGCGKGEEQGSELGTRIYMYIRHCLHGAYCLLGVRDDELTEVLSGIFPHRSLFYVMGIMTSDGMSCPRGLGPATLCPQASRGRGRL